MDTLIPLPRGADGTVPPAYRLPDAWQSVDFLSDVHLAAEHPETASALFHWLDTTPADAICVLGDLFDVWVGDDVLDADGFEQACVRRLRGASLRRPIHFLPGNRDFLIGQRFLDESGCTRLEDPCVLEGWGQQRLVVTHGDAWCLGDTDYQRFRAQVRDERWQRQILERPLAERQVLGRQIRAASEQRKDERGPDGYDDVDEAHAAQWLRRANAQALIHGHTHRPASEPFGDAGCIRHVLSDWEAASVPPRGDVLRWTSGGLQRLTAWPVSP